MPRNFRVATPQLYPYALPLGPHKVIYNAANVFAELTGEEYRAVIDKGMNPRYTVTIYDPRCPLVMQETEVAVASIREHTIRHPSEVTVGRVIEIYGQIYLPGYRGMVDVCMVHFSGYREGIMVPVNPHRTILDYVSRKKFTNVRAAQWVR